ERDLRNLSAGPPPCLNSVLRKGKTSQAHGQPSVGFSLSYLLQRYLGAAVFQLLLELLRFFLGYIFFHRLRRSFHQVLVFLGTQSSDSAHHLTHVNLLGWVEAVELDGEFRFLGGLGFSRGRSRKTGTARHDCRCRRLDLVDFFHVFA